MKKIRKSGIAVVAMCCFFTAMLFITSTPIPAVKGYHTATFKIENGVNDWAGECRTVTTVTLSFSNDPPYSCESFSVISANYYYAYGTNCLKTEDNNLYWSIRESECTIWISESTLGDTPVYRIEISAHITHHDLWWNTHDDGYANYTVWIFWDTAKNPDGFSWAEQMEEGQAGFDSKGSVSIIN